MSQRRAMVAVSIAAVAMLGGCGFDSPAVTSHERSAIQGSDFAVGSIDIRDAFVSAQTTSSGQRPFLAVTFVNNGAADVSLTGITSTAGVISLSGLGVTGGSLAIPPKGAPVSIQLPLADPAGPTAELASKSVPGVGTYVPMTFGFGAAGSSVSQQIPVVPATETTDLTAPVATGSATPLS